MANQQTLQQTPQKIERRLKWISGAATYATREFVESVGPMNESYFLYCEDVDWSLRRGRFRLGYAHDAVILHVGGTTTGQVSGSRSDLTVYLTERNKLMLTRDHFPLIYPIVLLASSAALVEYLLKGNWRGFAVGCRWLVCRTKRGDRAARALAIVRENRKVSLGDNNLRFTGWMAWVIAGSILKLRNSCPVSGKNDYTRLS